MGIRMSVLGMRSAIGAAALHGLRRLLLFRPLVFVAMLVIFLGAALTAVGQSDTELDRYVTLSVSGPSTLTVGASGYYSISTNGAGGYSWTTRTSSSALSGSAGCSGSGSWSGSPSGVTAYACKPGYASVSATLYFTDEDSGTIQEVDSASQSVRILNPKTD